MAAPSAETLRIASETAFLNRLLNHGEIEPGELDVPEPVKARIARMPMLAWKARNVRAHRAKS